MAARVPLVASGIVAVLAANAFLLLGDRARAFTPDDAVESYRDGVPTATGPPLPAPGVYLYDTEGHEAVDALSIRRQYPRVTPRIVTVELGCGWHEKVAIFHEHTETYDVCTDGTDARDTGFGTYLSYYGVGATTALRCGAGGTRIGRNMSPRETRTYVCAGGDILATVRVAYEGEGTALVEGAELPCRRVTVSTVLTGSNVGAARRTLCTDERTGLVLTEERSVGVTVRSRFVGRVSYSERATFRLRSLVPLT